MYRANPRQLRLSGNGQKIAQIDLVMIFPLIFESHEKLPASRQADALHELRIVARRERKDMMRKSEHIGNYLVFLDRLERLGEGAGGGKVAQVAMDVDPPPKKRTGGTYPINRNITTRSSLSQ